MIKIPKPVTSTVTCNHMRVKSIKLNHFCKAYAEEFGAYSLLFHLHSIATSKTPTMLEMRKQEDAEE